jgi:hypothetical protein
MEKGFTFKMKVSLTFPLLKGTIWELTELPKEQENVPLYKSTALFNKISLHSVTGITMLKPTKNNIIRLSQQAIERYLEKEYIEEWRRTNAKL